MKRTSQDLSRKNPKRAAVYVIFDKDGKLDNFRKYYLKELRKVVDHILVVVQGTLTPESRRELEKLSDNFFVRENTGLLTYPWIEGIKHIGWDKLENYDELLMLNDSFFGPFYPLKDMMDAAEKSDADFYGSMQNFEEKSYTTMAGRPLKHHHFRGSICYFYIIKSRLLHSPEFKKYWSEKPQINCDWDTYFFNEIDFYDYVKDAGFKIDSYQSDKLKGYFFDNLSHNMYKLIKTDKIPFARIRPFGTDMKADALTWGYAQDTRKTLDYIKKHTDYDVNMIWDYILRTKNLTHIYNELQLNYVVPKNFVEKNFSYNKKIAVILHIYYTDLVEKMADYCLNFPQNTDFYITTINKDTKKAIEKAFSERNLKFTLKTRPNVGVAMSTLWVTYKNITTDGKYEYICYFHDKKSPYMQFMMHGITFAERCYENLFGTPEVVKNIINLFEENPRLGILGAPMPYNGAYLGAPKLGWPANYQNTIQLARKLDLHVDIRPDIWPVSAYGDMMWYRADAFRKVFKKDFNYDFFDVPYKMDGTIMHAIERIYGYIAQDSGYYYADVINTDDARSDLSNYQYLLYNRFIHTPGMISANGNNSGPITSEIRQLIVKKGLKLQYWRYKVLSKITFGKMRKRYKMKKKEAKWMLKEM